VVLLAEQEFVANKIKRIKSYRFAVSVPRFFRLLSRSRFVVVCITNARPPRRVFRHAWRESTAYSKDLSRLCSLQKRTVQKTDTVPTNLVAPFSSVSAVFTAMHRCSPGFVTSPSMYTPSENNIIFELFSERCVEDVQSQSAARNKGVILRLISCQIRTKLSTTTSAHLIRVARTRRQIYGTPRPQGRHHYAFHSRCCYDEDRRTRANSHHDTPCYFTPSSPLVQDNNYLRIPSYHPQTSPS
jgi:hypothetical protein